jgi:3-hydroxy-9,10-secoandrosta-1,3,5(10)-triene-9,17-dione monooxygenase reductase component
MRDDQVTIDDGRRRIGSDPFEHLSGDPDAARRLRGRLASPVTVWTAYRPDGGPTGITVSSVLVAEGEPSLVIGAVGPLADFWDSVQRAKQFVVHVLGAGQVRVADQFALRYPGDPFEGLSYSASEWGPVLAEVSARAACVLSGYVEAGHSLLVRGEITDVVLSDDDVAPLVHYRGRYLTTGARGE